MVWTNVESEPSLKPASELELFNFGADSNMASYTFLKMQVEAKITSDLGNYILKILYLFAGNALTLL